MVLSLNVILFLTLHLLPGMKSSMVNLINNGYEGIVIAINPSVPEDEKLIENIKEMVTEASTYLFHATKRRVYFRNVRILIPMTWKSKSEYFIPKQESYDQADVIVANPYLIYGDDPYTLQYGRCSTHITGTNVVFKKCQGGSCVTRPCRRDSQTGLYEAKCTFIPEKSQTAKESIMFMQSLHSVTEFCTEETHNTEAPNLQNKMCNGKSTWDVIMNSVDFQNTSPMTEMNPPTHPTFSLLMSKQREDRLFRMNQAAELYLIQVIEKGSLVGMVTFDNVAEIQNHLTRITDDNAYQKITANLPQEASGGTSICKGLKAGFQAIIHSNQSTSGSEIILLTDGEDNEINLCFEDVKQSGAIIHTIALGPSAAKELETLSNMTGRKRVNGTVPIDSTIGNDTFFVVTWTIQKPEILLQDPKGKKYKTSDFKEDKLNIRSARLRIPGIAETGTWTYSLLNNHASSQMLTVTVTTRARSPTTPPVIATAHMSQNTAHYPSPVIVYAQVSQGFLPVLGINVTAIIETEDGHQVTLELWDNGAGADTVKNDGIYSRYFTDYYGNGRYSLKVHAWARNNMARLNLRQQNKALYVAGYVENGKIILNPPRPEVKDDLAKVKIEDFSRLTSGGSFTVSGAPPPPGNHPSVLPPSKITDLEAKFKEDYIQLSWTAPGNVLDKGKANSYVIRISKSFMDLQEDFDNATLVNTSNLIPKEAGSKENFEFKPEHFRIENGTKFYIAVQAINEANLISEVSHIVQAIKFIPLPEDSVHALGTKISEITLAIFGLPMIFSIF
ncbi:hypothetical protein Celaphus_00002366 [Cervus elaphus hippelaphus]|uniref:VWFA domain-containing protein n=1 Tax=Cervus elaphus hippelaphus TaxID=46360 RepID=A0A212CI94_CEREH|nr:hypothetical protein Celaphus_00002366 [Cervus elaphus hippelaphus]